MTMTNRRPINLALQGGGAHGAFTWGVLDRMLEDDIVTVEAISGTSAGAMNAVVMADGLMRGGAEAARRALAEFWEAMSTAARASPIQRTPIDILMGRWSLDASPGYHIMDAATRLLSPYQWNPLNINPLKDILVSVVDFERVRHCDQLKIFVSATNVETGRVRVFRREELTPDMVMASACLPLLYQAVEIDGVPYWDGGYMGNPVLFPFFHGSSCSDIVVIQINPIVREGAPKTAQEILNRMNEITFNSSLLKEFRAIEFVCRLLEEGALSPEQYRKMNVHVIEAQDELKPLGASSKLNAEWKFLCHLRDVGRETCDAWLKENHDAIGERSTVDLRAMFQGIGVQHVG